MKRSALAQVGVVFLGFAISAVLFPDLPGEMAIHWGPGGEPDGYASRFGGAFLLPALSAALLVVFRIVPEIDPFGANFDAFARYYEAFVTALLVFLLYVHGLVLAFNLGYDFDVARMLLPAAGVLVYVAGVVVENAERNWFVGIRTPWTLSSEDVWERTHDLAAPLLKVSAVLAVLGVLAPEYAVYLLAGPLAATALVTTVYSYYVYRQVENGPDAMSS